MSDEEAKRKAEILEIYRRRKNELEKKAALFGAIVDPSITIEIQDLEKQIEQLERQVRNQSEKTEDCNALCIDDVLVKKGKRHIILDVRLRNLGNKVINITRANVHVLSRTPFAAVYQPSASYDLLLERTENVIAVAHVLKSEEVDNFIIRVGFSKGNTSCGFIAELILHYNNTCTITSKSFRFSSTFD